MSRDLLCYACSRTTPHFDHIGDEQPQCPHCQSEFVEFREHSEEAAEPLLGAGMTQAQMQQAANPMQILTRLMDALSQQGAQVMVQGPGGLGGPFNFGDFGLGSMEEIMTQIMEQHEPQNNPTSQEVRDSLPKRKVPATSDHKGNEEYAVGANCKAGDPCSICHTEFAAEEEVSQLPCEHCFHDSCIKPWLEVQNTCPICRAVLPGSESGTSNAGTAQGTTQAAAATAAATAAAGPFGAVPHGQNADPMAFAQTLFGGIGGMNAPFGDMGVPLTAALGGQNRQPGSRRRTQRDPSTPSGGPTVPSTATSPLSQPGQTASRAQAQETSGAQAQRDTRGQAGSSAELPPRSINWLAGEGTPGGQRYDLADMQQLHANFAEYVGMPDPSLEEDEEDEVSDEVSSESTESLDDGDIDESEAESIVEETDLASESNSMFSRPGLEAAAPDDRSHATRDDAGNASIDEVIPQAPNSFSHRDNSALEKVKEEALPSDSSPSTSTPAPGAQQQSERDPYRIGFAGPPRMEGVVRSNSSSIEGNNDQNNGEGGGLGILTPIGWLARGAMNIGGNVFGRRP